MANANYSWNANPSHFRPLDTYDTPPPSSVPCTGTSELSPTNPSVIACPVRLALVGWDLTMQILQAGSLAAFHRGLPCSLLLQV